MTERTLDVAIPHRGSPIEWLRERGRARALGTGALEPRDEDISSLTALARATAAFVSRDEFNPASNPRDGIREALFQKVCGEVKQVDEASRIAITRSREVADQAARKRALVGQKPELPIIAMMAAVSVLAISVAPTLHDFVFQTLPDDILNWFLSIAVSALLGVMLAWGLFSTSVTSSRTPIVVGIVISVGLGTLRVSAAETLREVLFTVGLTLMEIGVVLFLDWRAGLYNKAVTDWLGNGQAAEEAEASSSVQQHEAARLAGEKKRLEAQVSDHLSYMEQRDELTRDGSAREQAYVGATCDSYLQAVAENSGRLQQFN